MSTIHEVLPSAQLELGTKEKACRTTKQRIRLLSITGQPAQLFTTLDAALKVQQQAAKEKKKKKKK